MRIYLNGFMASGKSTVGVRAAARLGLTFIDLDRLIEAHDGRSIPEIFAEDGEDTFRELERDALRRTAESDDLVVAVGGGALVDEENRALAKDTGRIIYLKVDPGSIMDRVADEAEHRPLLQDDSGTPLERPEMRNRIENMLRDRSEAYSDNHATVDAARSVDEVVTAVTSTVLERGWVNV